MVDMLPYSIGITDIHKELFQISPKHKQRHVSIFGKSGVGKTTLLRNMITWDIYHHLGVTVIDPHGGLIEEILQTIPRERTNDVIYINPQDPKRAIGMNIFESVSEAQKPLVVSSVISIMKNIWADSWGPRTEYILSNVSFALLSQPKPQTLIAIPKLLTDKDFRERIVDNISDPVVRDFFDQYDNRWSSRFREEAIAPLLNKVNKFTTNPLLRDVIGQSQSSFDFRWAMDSKKIILCNLSKGALGEDVSSLLGSLIVTKLAHAALSRQDVPESERIPHILYADEIQNFIHGVDFPTILSEARKYKLSLILATQTLSQLPPKSLSAVLGNCGTFASFRVSAEDAETLKDEFATSSPSELLQDLPDYKLYVRTLAENSDGVLRPLEPQLVNAFPPFSLEDGVCASDPERIASISLERYARPRAEVEKHLKKFFSH